MEYAFSFVDVSRKTRLTWSVFKGVFQIHGMYI